MASSNDAHKLIALSLGKIHAARGQRGGVNLHKNLLVAGVIIKARTIYMMGVQGQAFLACQEAEGEQEYEEEGGESIEESSEPEVESSPVSSPTPTPDHAGVELDPSPKINPQDADPSCQGCDKENDSSRANKKVHVVEKSHVEKDKVLSSAAEMDSDSPCQRCTKRRFTEDSDIVNSNTKRARVSSDTKGCQSTDSSTQCEPEPMQTDNAQISSLVHRFNSGLTGFLSCSGNAQIQDGINTDSSSECNTLQTTHNKDSHTVSCSTQIKEAFETLTRPVALALSV